MNAILNIKSKENDGRPLYKGIEQHFADLIIRNELLPGEKLPSTNELAASAGINSRTVLQAYQLLVKRGLAEVRAGRGTFVADAQENVVAIGLVGWNSDDVALHKGWHYSQALYAGIVAEAADRNIDCRIVTASADIVRECRDKSVAGCIFMGTEPSSQFLLKTLEQAKIKTISISGWDGQNTPLVRGDDKKGMNLILNHLFGLGHTRIALFYGDPNNYSAQRRLAEYQDEMSEKNINIHPSWICNDLRFIKDSNSLSDLFDMWQAKDCMPTAIIAAGEHSALAVLQVLHGKNIRIPQDISVCGYDDFPGIQEFATPALTVIRQPVVEIGRTAVRNLIGLLGGEKEKNSILPVELIVRNSTGKVK